MNLHYMMADSGRVLATRSRGKTVADHLGQIAKHVGTDEHVVIDFEGVEIVSSPFAQEVLESLNKLFGDRPELVGMNEDVKLTIGLVETRLGM